ncbi:ABC-three component system protein [Parabacteroides segnis]|uniref:ABC-three component system protein n=1 Tax=Parabacteroides segnis TaxID=2763058 RepID=UPI0035136E51
MTIDKIRNTHTIKVNTGSGVLLKPLSQEHLYIFTAYHVIDGATTENIKCIFTPESEYADQNIKVLDVVHNLEEDTAIIIIERNFEIDSFVSLYSLTKFEGNMSHVGFPSTRANDALSPVRVSYICSCDGIIENGFVEYEYRLPIRKDEIEGMSGGGIFTEDFRLVGVHTKSSCHDENEFLGKAVYIPIVKFRNLIKENKLSPVVEFDLNSFTSLALLVFDFTDQGGIVQMCDVLLARIDDYKYKLSRWSPQRIFDGLKGLKHINSEANLDEYNREYWILFSEFLIGMMVILEINTDDEDNFIKCVFEKFHYVYSHECFDVFETRHKLDLNLIVGMHGQSKLVVGGLKKNSYGSDVLYPTSVVPIISQGEIVQDNDIKSTSRRLLDRMTIINCNIFKDAIKDRCDDIGDSESQFEKYKQLLKQKIDDKRSNKKI